MGKARVLFTLTFVNSAEEVHAGDRRVVFGVHGVVGLERPAPSLPHTALVNRRVGASGAGYGEVTAHVHTTAWLHTAFSYVRLNCSVAQQGRKEKEIRQSSSTHPPTQIPKEDPSQKRNNRNSIRPRLLALISTHLYLVERSLVTLYEETHLRRLIRAALATDPAAI